MALVHFAKSEFNKSFEFISKINRDNIDMQYRLKYLTLIIYFKLNDFDSLIINLLLVLILSIFIIQHNDLNRESKKIYMNFINVLIDINSLRITDYF